MVVICSQTFPGIRPLFPFHPEFSEMNPRVERALVEEIG
jgi:hypothetical protein